MDNNVLHTIGKAQICLPEVLTFLQAEEKNTSNWTWEHREDYFCQHQTVLNIAKGNSRFQKKLEKVSAYMSEHNLMWGLLYCDDFASVIRYGSITLALPSEFVIPEFFSDMENMSISEMQALTGDNVQMGLVRQDTSMESIKKSCSIQEEAILQKKQELEAIEQKKKEELEKFRQELERQYASALDAITQKKKEMEIQLKKLKNQVFLMDAQIYSIRCFLGETIDFIPVCKGLPAKREEPVVLFQKFRFLDEEMAKVLSIFDFDGRDFQLFEDVLKEREDIRDYFAPGPKSISLVRVSRNSVQYGMDQMVANMLAEYETFHGNTIGILIRDGENLSIGWTDEDRIHMKDDMFYSPGKKEVEKGDVSPVSTKEDIVGRYYIFAILQGVLKSGQLMRLPEDTRLNKNSPFVIFSEADNWLEDNRFGTLETILNKTGKVKMSVKDDVLTTLRITRDDCYTGSGFFGGRNTSHDAYNNDRGRGEKNRTHDAWISDRTICPVNYIESTDVYQITLDVYKAEVETVLDSVRDGITYSHFETKKTGEFLESITKDILVENGCYYGKKVSSPEEVLELWKKHNGGSDKVWIECSISGEKGKYQMPREIRYCCTEYQYFLSALKRDSRFREDGNLSFANMEIFPSEYINLTYLNSVYIRYVIQTRKIGKVSIGGKYPDYAALIPYLQKALEYLLKREEKEAELLKKYMELYPDWQVDVSEWRLENQYHRLTDARAKKFAGWKKKVAEGENG